ncbi:MAG: hypothetical protein KME08_21060 [Aphanothece sp. CMT-3BRIN-NPC111]|nr:hypothetical protein [Aphanothece sp. CMT-3BRIN-NPC111]
MSSNRVILVTGIAVEGKELGGEGDRLLCLSGVISPWKKRSPSPQITSSRP